MKNAECGNLGVWKMRSVENTQKISILNFNFNFPFQMRINSLLIIKKRKKKRDESLHFKMRRAGMVISVVVFTNAPVLLSLRNTRPVFKENGSIVNS